MEGKREAGKKEGRQEEINEEGEGCKIRKNRRGEQAILSQLKAVWRLLVYGHKKQHPNPFRNRRLTFGGYKLPLGMATGPLRELRPATERYRLPFRRPTPCEAFSNSVRVSWEQRSDVLLSVNVFKSSEVYFRTTTTEAPQKYRGRMDGCNTAIL